MWCLARPRPAPAAVEQVAAGGRLRRALDLFHGLSRALLVEAVLRNTSVQTWCERLAEAGLRSNVHREMGRLLAVLDALARHFEDRDGAGQGQRRYRFS